MLSLSQGPALSHELRQEQSLSLAQRIEVSQLMAFHPAALKEVLDSIKGNPERAEGILSVCKERHGLDTAKSVFGYLHEIKGLDKSGFIGILTSPLIL